MPLRCIVLGGKDRPSAQEYKDEDLHISYRVESIILALRFTVPCKSRYDDYSRFRTLRQRGKSERNSCPYHWSAYVYLCFPPLIFCPGAANGIGRSTALCFARHGSETRFMHVSSANLYAVPKWSLEI